MRHRKDWERSECNHCQHYSDECRRGSCFWNPNNKRVPSKEHG